jgi:hypothetical protein
MLQRFPSPWPCGGKPDADAPAAAKAETATATIAARANMDILLGLSTHMRAGEPDGPDAD